MTDNPLSMYVLCEKGFTLNSIHKLAKDGLRLDDFINKSDRIKNLRISKPSIVQSIIYSLPLITNEELENNLYKLASEGISARNIQLLNQCGLKYPDIAMLTLEELNALVGSSKNALFTKVKEAYENIELRLGRIPITVIEARIELLISGLLPRESIPFQKFVECINAEFTDIDVEAIRLILQKKIEKHLIFKTEIGFSKKYKRIVEYLNEDFKYKDILLGRMNGKTLQEIGDSYGVSREAIRQKERAVINKMPKLEEIILYQEVFEKYDWDERIFQLVFNEPIEVYQLLNLIYDKGSLNILEHLDVLHLSEYQRNKILHYFEAFTDYEGNVHYLNNKMALFENFLYYYGRNLVNDEEVVSRINEFIKLHQFNSKYLTDINSVRGLADRSDKVLRDKSNAYRYYDYQLIDEMFLENLTSLVDLPTGVYSMQKIFNENQEFMKEIDIRSEHELHNLYKRLVEIDNVTFTRMPEFSIGNIDKNSFLIQLFHEQAPISLEEFTKFVEDNYGLKKSSLRSHIQTFLTKYIHEEEIRVDYVELEEEDLEKLKALLVEEIYTVEQLNKIGSVIDTNFHNKFLNNMTLMKLGYVLRGSYVLTESYGSVDRYFSDLILSQDYFEKEQKEIYKTLSFNKALYDLEKDLDIVKIEKNVYITTKKLGQAGVLKEDLLDFRNKAISLAQNRKFFTLHTLRKSGLIHPLEALGFDSIFYERILWTAPNIRTIPLAVGNIYLITNKEISLTDFIRSIVEEKESINLYELQDYVKDTYKISIDIPKITSLVRDSEMYYSEDMCKIYIDKNTFYEEIY